MLLRQAAFLRGALGVRVFASVAYVTDY